MEMSRTKKVLASMLGLLMVSGFIYSLILSKERREALDQSENYTVFVVVDHDKRRKGGDYIDIKAFVDNKVIRSNQERVSDLKKFPIGSFHKTKYAFQDDDLEFDLKGAHRLKLNDSLASTFHDLNINIELLEQLNDE